ncbi:hypothetical protein TSAR_011550 [Trichomalopsis sarcophagae]|uniref:MADF domain-containing protein n=1 Tax=Trichomalopsis sarcophagae TaxID=543379 RepID=A0A232EIM0_9HYME|nr:hypothetical protein TSAR_011550 [Trichomalopsis sarcophagae]
MDENKVAQLINEVHERSGIWDKSLALSKRNKGHEWNKVAAALNVSKTTAQNKWKALIAKFKHEHNLVQFHSSGDGLEDTYQSSWPYYKSLLFLKNNIPALPSKSNLS